MLTARLRVTDEQLQVPTTQLAKMSIDPKFVELTADVLNILPIKYVYVKYALLGVFSGGGVFFLAFSAAGQARAPSVQCDACRDTGRGP